MSRPKRKARTANTTATDASLPTDEVMPSDSDGETQPPQKRRKNAKGFSARLKKKRAGPPSLNNMPLDILFEICETLEPMDVLSLSRTSTYLYYTLMDTDAASAIWKTSRSLIEGLPDCPSDLTEAQYARLMFGKDCYRCLKKPQDLHTTWVGRTRLCTACVQATYSTWPSSSVPSSLSKYVPVITLMKHRQAENYRCERTTTTWAKAYEGAENKPEWIQNKIEERKHINNHAELCRYWNKSWALQLVARRKAKVVERIRALGWGSELARIRYERDKPENQNTIISACQKELTERALLKLEPYINDYMTRIQEQRLRDERYYLEQKATRVLEDILETHSAVLPPNVLVPSLGDLFALPIVQETLNGTTRSVDLEAELGILRQTLTDISAEWKRNLEVTLCGLIRSACGESYDFEPDTVLHLATTTFRCVQCTNVDPNGGSVWYPKLFFHPHCKTPIATKKSEPWNHNQTIEFRNEDMLSVSTVLTQFGFDPKITTAAEMDATDHIFECLTCNSQHVGRMTMRWRGLASHIGIKHSAPGSPPPDLILLEGNEAEGVKRRLDEETARYRARAITMFCVHCKKEDIGIHLEDHVRKVHDIANPSEADMVLREDVYSAYTHRLWPPREDQDDETVLSPLPPT